MLQAKDLFYKCVEDNKVDFQVGTTFPGACKQQRTDFEKACKSSWVSKSSCRSFLAYLCREVNSSQMK